MPKEPSRAPLAEERTAHETALVVVDMFSDWQFPDCEVLSRRAAAMAPTIAALRRRAAEAGVLTVFVNDNVGRWRSDSSALVEASAKSGDDGAAIAAAIAPRDVDYFVLKPKHSAFYETPLDLLLRHLGARRVIVAGVATEQCIELTAMEARMRDYRVAIAADGVAGVDPDRAKASLEKLEALHEVLVRPAADIRFPPAKD